MCRPLRDVGVDEDDDSCLFDFKIPPDDFFVVVDFDEFVFNGSVDVDDAFVSFDVDAAFVFVVSTDVEDEFVVSKSNIGKKAGLSRSIDIFDER